MSPTGAGNVIVVFSAGNITNINDFITAVSDSAGSSYSVPTDCQALDAGGSGNMSCAYTLSSVAGATSITVTRTVSISEASWVIRAAEFSSDRGSVAYDTSAGANLSTITINPVGPALTLTGTNDVIVQAIRGGNNLSGVAAPYTGFLGGNSQGSAYALNMSSGSPGPTWTQPTGARCVMAAIAIKEALGPPGYTTSGGGGGSGYAITGGWPFDVTGGGSGAQLPQVWVNSLEWIGTTSNVINFPVSLTRAERRVQLRSYMRRNRRRPTQRWLRRHNRSGGSWTCGSTSYGPYIAGCMGNIASCGSGGGLQQAVTDAEACRAANGSGTQINIPAGALFSASQGIVLPTSLGDPVTNTNFIVLQSTTPLPWGRTVCAHGVQDNVPQSTQPGIRNVGCNATNLSYQLGPTVYPISPGAFTLANGTATNTSAYNDVASMYTIEWFAGNNNAISTAAAPTGGVAPHHFAIRDAELRPKQNFTASSSTALIGIGGETTTAQIPTHIHFSYDYMHSDCMDAAVSGGVATGPAFCHSSLANIVNFQACIYCSISYTYMDQALRPGGEGHGISVLLSNQLKFVHNWIEGESIGHLSGGFANTIPFTGFMVDQDEETRGNRYTYPTSWLLGAQAGYNPNSFYNAVEVGTGTGTNGVIHVTGVQKNVIYAAALQAGGSGYAVNDVVQASSLYDGGTNGTFLVTGVGAGGTITSLTIQSGSGYTVANNVPMTGSAHGSGATINITNVSPTGAITGATLASGGTGYVASDNLSVVQTGGSGGVIVVNTVSAGVITAIYIGSGTGYHYNGYGRKNAHEYKFSNRILLDGNIFENADYSGAQGTTISFKANQSSAGTTGINYWTTQINSTITNNIIRHGCNGTSMGFRSNNGSGGGGGVSDSVALYTYTNNLMYDISLSNPGCFSAPGPYAIRVASDANGTLWGATSASRASNVTTMVLNGSTSTGNGQSMFHPGDPILVYGCTGDTSFNTSPTWPQLTLGPLALAGTVPTSLTILYSNSGPDTSTANVTGCTISNVQGTPQHLFASHNSDFMNTGAAGDPASGALGTTSHPCLMNRYLVFTNSITVGGGANATSVGEGTRTTDCTFDPSTETYSHTAFPGRDKIVSCPGHASGPGGIAACYKEYNNGVVTAPPLTLYGTGTTYCTGNDPTVEDCLGLVGEMGTTSFNYNLPNWHDFRPCHGEPQCNGKTSPYAAGGLRQASDGYDLGLQSFSAIDGAETSSQYCVPNCSIGSFPDHP